MLLKTIIDVDDSLIFLAGPISSATLWHDKVIEAIRTFDKSIYLALSHKRETEFEKNDSYYNDRLLKQLECERYYLERASNLVLYYFGFQYVENMIVIGRMHVIQDEN